MADDAAFIQVFTETLSPDQNVRRRAELQLRQVETQDGMLSAVLSIVANEQVAAQARLNAAIYLKNRCSKAWTSASGDTRGSPTHQQVPNVDKQYIKQNILSVLCETSANNQLKLQLKTALGSIIYNEDFPVDWPDLLPSVQAGLKSNDERHVEASLMALVEMFKKYRFMSTGRQVPAQMVEQVLPVLVSFGSHMLQATPQPHSPPILGRCLHLIFKVYRLSSQVELSQHHQSTIVEWGTLMLQVVNRQLDPAQLPSDAEDREKCSWWKAKKWAYFNLNRLFLRYGSPSQLPSNLQEYAGFAANFEAHFAPEIFRAYLKQIESWILGQNWLSERCTKHIIEFFDECVKPKSTWALLKPQLDSLVSHFLFPVICPTDEELQEFDDDPVEYAKLHSSEAVWDYYIRPEVSALNMLRTLADARPKTALGPLLAFVTGIVGEYPAKRTPKELEGALRIIHHLAIPIIKSKTFGPQMEKFFEQFVFPLFASEHGYLRSRACNLVESFEAEDTEWKNVENINIMFGHISNAMADPALPVRIAAATALPELVRYDQLRTLVAPNIGRIMHELLSLAKEVDLDIMSDTMRKLVDDFSAELIPYTEDLSVQVCQSYLRIMQESLDARDVNGEDDGAAETKAMAALGTLKTMQDLLAGVHSSPEIVGRLEPIILPALLFTLQHEFLELYDEVFDMINTLIFRQRRVSDGMWRAFELLHATFKSTAIDYLDEMLPPLDNFISFGGQAIAAKAGYLNMLMEIFTISLTSDSLGAVDRVTGCKLAECMLLNMRGLLDHIVPTILGHALTIITRQNTHEEPIITTTLYLHALELVINALFYNPILTIQYLDAHKQTQVVFEKWSKKLDKFFRVHDRKLGIVAVCAILASLPSLPAFVEAGGHLLNIAAKLFEGLPDALIQRQKEEKEYDESINSESTVGDDADEAEEAVNEDGDDGDFKEDNNDYEDYLSKKIAERMAANGNEEGSDLSEAWAEEVLFESPLDQVDAYVQFATTLGGLETSQPAIFAQIVRGLDANQQSHLVKISEYARSGGEKAVLAAHSTGALGPPSASAPSATA